MCGQIGKLKEKSLIFSNFEEKSLTYYPNPFILQDDITNKILIFMISKLAIKRNRIRWVLTCPFQKELYSIDDTFVTSNHRIHSDQTSTTEIYRTFSIEQKYFPYTTNSTSFFLPTSTLILQSYRN